MIIIMNKVSLLLLCFLFLHTACSKNNYKNPIKSNGSNNKDHYDAQITISVLNQDDLWFIKQFNACAADIKNFKFNEENIGDYFYVFKNVNHITDAKFILVGESHTDAKSQLWNARLINSLISKRDIVLFEGDQVGTKIKNLGQYIIIDLLATRIFEVSTDRNRAYDSTIFDTIKRLIKPLFIKTKNHLNIKILTIDNAWGSYWDLLAGSFVHSDDQKRNDTMVLAMSHYESFDHVFVLAGALHLPHYSFANTMKDLKNSPMAIRHFLASYEGADINVLNDAFYHSLMTMPEFKAYKTKSIFNFLKDRKFAVLIPKNLPGIQELRPYFPL